ncbi:sugar phosphate isomerase/epimerase [Streptomyces sp. NP160]|uniref:sugar phosphate isomerase/epimerase family protein n=1 Tax=Streptomyces sp. NP160 TaxID=2586637 RepID=UPI001119FAA5|nr:sugar phosphate isomerase/epimerase [Streptomyces sp. NP160]TNM66903.1 sugar phosphate isomerase/epimerase [Streptomyces sp. NP160]
MGSTTRHELVATCWTSAGDVVPAAPDERSPLPLAERVRAVADTGWVGLGLLHADLEALGASCLGELADLLRREGLGHVEVELLDGWWAGEDDHGWRTRWELLLAAAGALGAAHVKVTPPPVEHTDDLVPRLRELAEEAGAVGTRLALEPLPWTAVASVPAGVELALAVDRPALGVCVDAWHVFRAGTSLEELAAALERGGRAVVVAVELDDADPGVVGTLFEDTRDRRRYCGEGSFDLAGFVRVLRAAGFDGPWGVEALSAEHRAQPLREGLVRARDTALAVLAGSTDVEPAPAPPTTGPR